MGIERIVLPAGLAIVLAGGISSLVISSAQAQNAQEVQDRRGDDDSARSTISREEALRLAKEYSVPVEEVYRVDRELRQPVEETLRGLPIVKVGDWDDFARAHPFEYDNINYQNFPQFLDLYQQFIDQVAPIYWREVKQENIPVEERKPVISFLWSDEISRNVNSSRGGASLINFICKEFGDKLKIVQSKVWSESSVYSGQSEVLKKTFFITGHPGIQLYSVDNTGEVFLAERGGGVETLEKLFRNRRVFKEYICSTLLR